MDHIDKLEIKIQWFECFSYDDAKDFHSCVYIHEWDGNAYYVGMIGKSVFGGPRRKLEDGEMRNPRYGPSYSHWIDGCLEHGARLFVGISTDMKAIRLIKTVENELIGMLNPIKNKATNNSSVRLVLKHSGKVPSCLYNEMN